MTTTTTQEPQSKKIERTCPGCGTKILVYPSWSKRREQMWCSKECRREHPQMPTRSATCQQCGETFTRRASGKSAMKYCSKQCYDQAQRADEHGATMYTRGCRCDVCRAAVNKRQCRYIKERRLSIVTPSPRRGTFRHGTTYGYLVGRCRCDLCSGAYADYQRSYKQRRLETLLAQVNRPDGTHEGQTRLYRYGCRCQACREALTEQRKAVRT